MHIFVLRIVHTLIVYLWQCVQLHTKFFELLTFLLVFELWQSVKINILRMESKDTYTRVRIRVGPGMCDSGVVDREDLEHSLTRCCHPVNHLHQVTEIAYSEAVLTTQREDGDEGSCATRTREFEVSYRLFIDHNFAVIDCLKLYLSVCTCLPLYAYVFVFVDTYKLKLQLRVFYL